MLPLSVPAIASLTLLTFVNTWNDYLGPLIYLRNPDLWTIQLGLQSFVSTLYDANYALLFAGLTMSVVPSRSCSSSVRSTSSRASPRAG